MRIYVPQAPDWYRRGRQQPIGSVTSIRDVFHAPVASVLENDQQQHQSLSGWTHQGAVYKNSHSSRICTVIVRYPLHSRKTPYLPRFAEVKRLFVYTVAVRV